MITYLFAVLKCVLAVLRYILAAILKFIHRHYTNYTNITHVSKNTYYAKYWYMGREYRILLDIKKRPPKIEACFDENDRNITRELAHLLGPNGDFHMFKPTPSKLGYESIQFEFFDGSHVRFESDEPIQL